jgi:hypothetical protein
VLPVPLPLLPLLLLFFLPRRGANTASADADEVNVDVRDDLLGGGLLLLTLAAREGRGGDGDRVVVMVVGFVEGDTGANEIGWWMDAADVVSFNPYSIFQLPHTE